MKRCWPLLLLAGCAGAPDPGPLVELKPATFQAVLVERGVVGSVQEVKLSAPFDGKVDTLVPEGRLVKPGLAVVQMGAEEARDIWERAQLKVKQQQLQVPLTEAKGRFEAWRLGLERDNALLDLRMARLRYQLLDEGRAGTAIVEASETLGTLKAERETLAATLPEAIELHRKGYLSDKELAALRKRRAEIAAEERATRAKLDTLVAGPRNEELALERLKVEQAASQLEGARKRLKAGLINRGLDLARERQALARASETARYRKAKLEAGKVKSPVAGVVIYEEIWTGGTMAKVKAGDTVDEGSSLVVVADPAHQVVRASINDAAAARLALGLKVHCRCDAYPDMQLEGKVAAIAPVAGTRLEGDLNKLQAVEVEVALDHPDARLRPGMTANLEFVLAAEPNRLAVPSEALIRDKDGVAVRLLEDPPGWWRRPQLVRRAVTTGASNERETVLLTGVKAGDKVVLR